MPEPEYERILAPANAILLEFLNSRYRASGHAAPLVDRIALQSDLNARLHSDSPDFASWHVRVAVATPVPIRGVFLSLMLEVIHNGTKVAVWTVDYDGAGHLQLVDPGFLKAERVDPSE